jgi:hypothetical protein
MIQNIKGVIMSSTATTVEPNLIETDISCFKKVRNAIQSESTGSMLIHYLDFVLRNKSLLFNQIINEKNLGKSIIVLSILTVLMSATYGFFMGIGNGFQQMIASALKLPMLFALTTCFSVPSLYVFSVLHGHRFKFKQTVALQMTSISITTILLASLAPLALVCYMTQMPYRMMVLVHVFILTICGFYGVRYLKEGFTLISKHLNCDLHQNEKLLRIWIGVYAFTGAQLGWFLRPFIGNSTEPFTWFREQSGEFFSTVFRIVFSLLTQ